MSKARAKGTGGENELLQALFGHGVNTRRTPMGTKWDLERDGFGPVFEVLATRPDYGRWLVTVRLDELVPLLVLNKRPLHIEVKRRKSFWHHTTFEEKFGKDRG